ncbi:MAG: CHAT domain-containing protein [Pseudomonadota bacterium]
MTPSGDLLADEQVVHSVETGHLLAAGRYLDAIAPLSQALDQARLEEDVQAEAASLHDLGVAYLGLGELDEAAERLNLAIRRAETAGLMTLAASALDNLGTLHTRRPGESAEAAASYRRAIGLAEAEGNRPLAFNALTNMARLDLDAARIEDAASLLTRAKDQLASMADGPGKIEDTLLLGKLWTQAGSIEAAYTTLNDAREHARAAEQPRQEALASGYLADLYAQSERNDDAAILYDQAAFLAQAADAPDLVYRWRWQAGRLTAKTGDTDRAIDYYRAAVDALDRLRPTLIEGGTGTPNSFDLRAPYVELADLILRRAAGNADAEAKNQDLEEARDTIERYRSTELTDYFQDECVTDLLASVESVDKLAPNTAVLYPILMADRLVILLSLADGLQQRSIPLGADALGEKILAFRQLLEKRTTNQYLRPARELYDLLLRPLEPTLAAADIDTLVIVPDDALRTVPLGALHDGERFLVDRYALATVPSLRLIEPKPLTELGLQPLLTGLSEPVQGFPALPHVDDELTTIGNLIGGNVLRNQNFVTGQIQRSLSATPHSVVHIASHAQFTGDAKDSFILTYDGRLDMDSLERFIKQSRFRDQPVELLTLSACETAAGDDRAALGLAGLAVKSGARSALASLWHVNDQASSILIADFYERLQSQPGITKAEALQQAQVETKKDLRFRHPAYWAPLVMIGNWL